MDDFQVVADRIQNQYAYGNSQTISSEDIELWGGSSLSDLLSSVGTYSLGSYGSSGALSTLSIRGAGGSRTLATWNGLPINSATSGDMDLSMISSNAFSSITINSSANSSAYGSGAMGGSIDLQSKAEFNNKGFSELNIEYGSFSTTNVSAKFSGGDSKLAYNSVMSIQESDADFPYFDLYYNKKMNRQNAGYKTKSWIQTVAWRPSLATVITFSNWLQQKHLQIAAENKMSPKNAAESDDTHLRVYSDIIHCFNTVSVKGKIAYFYERLDYWKKLKPTAINFIDSSLMKRRQIIADFNSDISLTKELTLQLGANFINTEAESYSYDGVMSERSLAFIPSLSFNNKNCQFNLSFRHEWNSRYTPDPSISFGARYNIPETYISFVGNLGTKYNTPTFNDKYWRNWGNPDIKPEYGYTYEYGIEVNKSSLGIFHFSGNLNYYYLKMNDLIKWLPVEGGVWHPYNYEQTTSKGYEFKANFSIDLLEYTLFYMPSITYTDAWFTKANEELALFKNGDRIPYTPEYKIVQTLGITTPFNLTLTVSQLYNTSMMDQTNKLLENSDINQFNASILYKISKSINTFFTIKNIRNRLYELQKNYPQPGRQFKLGLTIVLNNNNK